MAQMKRTYLREKKRRLSGFYVVPIAFCMAVLFTVVVFRRRGTVTTVPVGSADSLITSAKRVLEAAKSIDHPPEVTESLERIISNERNVVPSEDVTRSPQYKAVEWLVADESARKGAARSDPSDAVPPAVRLLQRYALAVLYFATDGDRSNECSRKQSSPCETTALSKDGEELSSRFLSDSHVCSWHGITCSSENTKAKGKVTWIDLTGRGLTGTVPNEVALLSDSLELLWLSDNPGLVGSIPRSIGALKELKTLGLYRTGMGGTLPDALYGLRLLTSLRLYGSAFSGSLSSSVGKMTNLEWLWLHQNAFTGAVPSELSGLTKLESLTLHGNRFENRARNGKFDIVPEEFCRSLEAKGRNLQQLWTDCRGTNECLCCTKCFGTE